MGGGVVKRREAFESLMGGLNLFSIEGGVKFKKGRCVVNFLNDVRRPSI
jgi:hypothetical protein